MLNLKFIFFSPMLFFPTFVNEWRVTKWFRTQSTLITIALLAKRSPSVVRQVW